MSGSQVDFWRVFPCGLLKNSGVLLSVDERKIFWGKFYPDQSRLICFNVCFMDRFTDMFYEGGYVL